MLIFSKSYVRQELFVPYVKTIRLLNENWVCPLKCDAPTAYIIAFVQWTVLDIWTLNKFSIIIWHLIALFDKSPAAQSSDKPFLTMTNYFNFMRNVYRTSFHITSIDVPCGQGVNLSLCTLLRAFNISITLENKFVCVLRDYNVNTYGNREHNNVHIVEFSNQFMLNVFTKLITKPTKIFCNKKSLLDFK